MWWSFDVAKHKPFVQFGVWVTYFVDEVWLAVSLPAQCSVENVCLVLQQIVNEVIN